MVHIFSFENQIHEAGDSDCRSGFEGTVGNRWEDAEGRFPRPRLALAPCLSLDCPISPGVSAGSLTWALSTGLPAEDGDHHLRREGTAAGQRLREGAEYVPGPVAPLLVPLFPLCIYHV